VKKLATILAGLAIAVLAGCETETRVHTVGPDTRLLCDVAGDSPEGCDGANPEKGIRKTCLPEGRPIIDVRPAAVDQGVIVECGPKSAPPSPPARPRRR
jgi:hypothetical protein